MKTITTICIVFLFMSITPCLAATILPCGSFKTISGDVFIQRQQNTIPAVVGGRVYPRDQIQSGGLIITSATLN